MYITSRTITHKSGTKHVSYLLRVNPVIWTQNTTEAKTYTTKTKANEDIKIVRKYKAFGADKEQYEVIQKGN